ncbi:hypothetical protein OU997_05200 [Pseudomonas sp. SL4(2022)]|uniref:hypothetical protein n=1 Tax=Pseudomonas sp. SL4(2022) TaxID=2994661 RepID=UPI0022720F43|nr:hypothetical protein [Pseudomonas sp. SL4(2022)]WAC45569.1 hypothetical protein OU997_05200 [Pseudomonas sp. SL4(2022)]
MQPARLDLRIIQGATLRKPLLLMQPVYRYKPITTIQARAPLLLTVEAHDLNGEWPIWIEGVIGWSELSRDKTRQPFHLAKVVDANTLELNAFNGTGRNATGGMVVYQPPVDLTGCTARMFIRDAASELLLELTAENDRLVIAAPGRLIITLTAAETAAITWAQGRYDLELTMSNGDVTRWAEGEVVVSREVTHD